MKNVELFDRYEVWINLRVHKPIKSMQTIPNGWLGEANNTELIYILTLVLNHSIKVTAFKYRTLHCMLSLSELTEAQRYIH